MVIAGCKILYKDSKTMVKLKYNSKFYGASYSLQQRKHMETTSSDLLKMIPFSVFIIVPGAELLLPPCLYIFPNMIPSTFQSKAQKEKK
jgi:LETM1 and EF-hand domain-containing protein 1